MTTSMSCLLEEETRLQVLKGKYDLDPDIREPEDIIFVKHDKNIGRDRRTAEKKNVVSNYVLKPLEIYVFNLIFRLLRFS